MRRESRRGDSGAYQTCEGTKAARNVASLWDQGIRNETGTADHGNPSRFRSFAGFAVRCCVKEGLVLVMVHETRWAIRRRDTEHATHDGTPHITRSFRSFVPAEMPCSRCTVTFSFHFPRSHFAQTRQERLGVVKQVTLLSA